MSWDGTGIYNGRDIPTGITVCANVCVIGAGPAGITAAWKLAEAGLKVILLEGSRQLHYPPAGSSNDYWKDSWPDKEKLYNGVATGIFADNEPEFLVLPTQDNPPQPWERERVFGGTPVHGGGQCRPHDPIDIEGREPAFPRWPITHGELQGFYKEASLANYLTGDYPVNFTAEFWEQKLGLKNAILKLDGFDAEMYQFMGGPENGGKWRNFATRPWGESQQTIEHFVQVIVNATVLNIHLEGTSVRWLEVASMQDGYPDQPMHPPDPKKATEFRVKADIYILACGAVENARQLLLSKIGKKELVGHYFMCHPLSRGSIISTNGTYLSDAQYRLMQGCSSQVPVCDWRSPWFDPVLGNTVQGRFITNPQTTKAKGIGRCWFWANNEGGASQMYMEMAPNYESYVTLDPDDSRGDPVFGQQRTKINWCLDHTTDKRTYEVNCQLFNEALKALNKDFGIKYPCWEKTFEEKQWIVNGHHMGTTRMSIKPEEGVVDENLKVHGLGNLYVAGSSVFPSGAISNPTFTIVALSLRLAAHLRKQLAIPEP